MSMSVEELLFDELGVNARPEDAAPVFIMAAPRTGSTTFYKSVVENFGLPFISNLTNEYFAQTPIIGLSLQKAFPPALNSESRFGKTVGALQPSEGSAVFTHWFGGGHPSQITSHTIKPEMETHFIRSMVAAGKLYQVPLVVKNAWNCFRIPYLANALPNARFIWLQRDVVEAAGSDLHARHVTKNSADAWNSATPANYEELLKRSPVEQVVENQFEFNRAIGSALGALAPNRWLNIWFEEFLADQSRIVRRIASQFELDLHAAEPIVLPIKPEGGKLGDSDRGAIQSFVHFPANRERFQSMRYGGAS